MVSDVGALDDPLFAYDRYGASKGTRRVAHKPNTVTRRLAILADEAHCGEQTLDLVGEFIRRSRANLEREVAIAHIRMLVEEASEVACMPNGGLVSRYRVGNVDELDTRLFGRYAARSEDISITVVGTHACNRTSDI